MHLKTWVEINRKSVEKNIGLFRGILSPKVRLWAVIKSNAYGHGLVDFAKISGPMVHGFCVDSVPEGLKLRKNGLKNPILTLGPTLPGLIREAAENSLILSISSLEALKNIGAAKTRPEFHLKIDTGMHRQGFYPADLKEVSRLIKKYGLSENLKGVFTHFASAKDINYPTYTDLQLNQFQKAVQILEKAGFRNLMKHAAATGGTLANSKYHLDAVRIGIGLYGLWPSKELQLQTKKMPLKPALSWHSVISEIKKVKKGDYIGYDLSERMPESGKIAIVPIGYWHGFPRNLSGSGEVLVNGRKAKVLGRVSMDLLIINATDTPCKVGDKVTLIGKQKSEELSAFDVAQKSGTIHYELLTRINPLIERIIK